MFSDQLEDIAAPSVIRNTRTTGATTTASTTIITTNSTTADSRSDYADSANIIQARATTGFASRGAAVEATVFSPVASGTDSTHGVFIGQTPHYEWSPEIRDLGSVMLSPFIGHTTDNRTANFAATSASYPVVQAHHQEGSQPHSDPRSLLPAFSAFQPSDRHLPGNTGQQPVYTEVRRRSRQPSARRSRDNLISENGDSQIDSVSQLTPANDPTVERFGPDPARLLHQYQQQQHQQDQQQLQLQQQHQQSQQQTATAQIRPRHQPRPARGQLPLPPSQSSLSSQVTIVETAQLPHRRHHRFPGLQSNLGHSLLLPTPVANPAGLCGFDTAAATATHLNTDWWTRQHVAAASVGVQLQQPLLQSIIAGEPMAPTGPGMRQLGGGHFLPYRQVGPLQNQQQPVVGQGLGFCESDPNGWCPPIGCNLAESGCGFASPGLLGSVYTQFRTHFWLDRLLLWLGVALPLASGLGLFLLHACFGLAHCLPPVTVPTTTTGTTTFDTVSRSASGSDDLLSSERSVGRVLSSLGAPSLSASRFIDYSCSLQLTSSVLRGIEHTALLPEFAVRSVKRPVRVPVSGLRGNVQMPQASLQHECYPFLLLLVALFMWLPHSLWQRSVDASARRSLCLVRSEFHSFREAVCRELASLAVGFGPGNLNQPQPGEVNGGMIGPQYGPNAQGYYHPSIAGTAGLSGTTGGGAGGGGGLGGTHRLRGSSTTPIATFAGTGSYGPAETSARLTGATLGQASLFAASSWQQATAQQAAFGYAAPHMQGDGCRRSGDHNPFALGQVDFAGLHSCQIDWSLNTYLADWQNSGFYWRRYLTKHGVLAVFQLVGLVAIVYVVVVHQGAPFSALFRCQLSQTVLSATAAAGNDATASGTNLPNFHFRPSQSDADMDVVTILCSLKTTFLVNISVLCFALVCIAGLVFQAIFFYTAFFQSKWLSANGAVYLGLPIDRGDANWPNESRGSTIWNENKRCFFGDYIGLMAYAALPARTPTVRRQLLHGLSVLLQPGLFRTDFHYLGLLCQENMALLSDALQVHFWTQRQARLLVRQQDRQTRIPSATASTGVVAMTGGLSRGHVGSGGLRRTPSVGQLLRTEDLSSRFRFSKVRIRAELNHSFH